MIDFDIDNAVSAVSDVTGRPASEILSKRGRWQNVEARQLLTHLLKHEGAIDAAIARLLGCTQPNVIKLRKNAAYNVEHSVLFRAKFNQILFVYESRKSLRVSQD